ncbi:MAG: flippase [Acutalibacteraceae bacterium]|nr:flippase [Acutalibacteraceae bacterium]
MVKSKKINPSLKNNIILNTIYQILTVVTPFITAPYISRVLGADGVGTYSYTQSIQTYFLLCAALGTASYGAREIARNRDSVEKRSKLFWEIELMSVSTSAFIIILWFIFVIFSSNYKIIYLILSLNIIAVMMDISWFFTGLEQFKYIVSKNMVFKILGIICIFVFVKNKDDLLKYIVIMTLSTFLGNLSMWLAIPKFICKVRIKSLNIFSHFKETLVYFLPTIATSIYTVLDKSLIGLITNDLNENGYYEQATKIINIAKSLTFTALNSVMGARISYLFSENKTEEVRKHIRQSIEYIMFTGVGIAFGILGIAHNFVPVFFGPGYDRVIGLLYVFSPMILIIGISNCLGSHYYTPSGKRAQSAKYLIAGSICNLVLNLALIPIFGSRGAAIASVLAESFITALYFKNCSGFITLKGLCDIGWKKIISGILMLTVVLLIGKIQVSNKIILIGLQVVCGVFVYVIGLLAMKDVWISQIIMNFSKRKIKFK